VITERALKVVLVLVGIYHVAQGALALIDPGTFFDEIGRYGVENDHYVGDNGAFVLAFGIAVLVAVSRPAWRGPVLALGALWYGLHAINHAFDVGEARSDARGIADTVALAVGAVFSAYLAWVAARLEAGRPVGEERSP
jgi:hypothetical protein